MSRSTLTIGALFAAGFIAIFGYTRLMRPEVAQPVAAEPLTVAPVVAAVTSAQPAEQPAPPVEQAAAVPQPNASSPKVVSPDAMAQWSQDARGADPRKRAAAIEALAGVSKEQAVPVLQGVLISGDPQIDRPLALRTLRELAERQGDADGSIHDALRHAIYHGDDEATSQAAQEILSLIDGVSAPASPNAKPRTRG